MAMAKSGGWTTFPFILATNIGVTFAYGGIIFNLVTYLVQDFKINQIKAAQIFNVLNGCVQIFPLLGAIIADSFLGCYYIIWISSLILSLGIMLLVVMAISVTKMNSESGSSPSGAQLGVLYTSLALIAFGVGVKRYNIGPMGANQFNTKKEQGIFFNWYIFTLYFSLGLSTISIGYVGEKVSWGWGFAISGLFNLLGLAVYLSGTRFYRKIKPNGSPFVGLARVVVAAIKKRKLHLSEKKEDYLQDSQKQATLMPSSFFRFLNRAALKMEEPDGSIRQPWKLCSVKEVEDFKRVMKLVPLWSTTILVNVPIIIQYSASLLQALTMDRHLPGSNRLQMPASSINIFVFIGTCSTIFILDRVVLPTWEKLRGRPVTLLQRVGVGHVVDIVCMVVSALVEIKRLKMVKLHGLRDEENPVVIPMSIFWLIPGLVLSGVGEGFHIPGNFTFNYQEFPTALKSTSNGIVGLAIGIAFYVGVAIIDVVKRKTDWMPDNINRGRLDNVFWFVGVLGGINFCYFLVCAYFYHYQDVEEILTTSIDDDEK